MPGAGEFDLTGFVRTLDAMGVDVPFEVEVISLELDRLAAGDAAQRHGRRRPFRYRRGEGRGRSSASIALMISKARIAAASAVALTR